MVLRRAQESSDDEFDGVAGRARRYESRLLLPCLRVTSTRSHYPAPFAAVACRSFERDVNMPRVHSSSPVATPHGVVRRMLKQLHTWDFDIFEFNDVCHGRPLAYVLTEVLTRYNLIEKHQIDKKCLASFSNKLEWEYCYNPQRRNPYHGNVHAADVTQAVVHFLCTWQGVVFGPAALPAQLTACVLLPLPRSSFAAGTAVPGRFGRVFHCDCGRCARLPAPGCHEVSGAVMAEGCLCGADLIAVACAVEPQQLLDHDAIEAGTALQRHERTGELPRMRGLPLHAPPIVRWSREPLGAEDCAAAD